MSYRIGARCAGGLVLLSVTAGAHAAVAWNESVNGDLSNNGLAPTPVTLVPGSNTVSGRTGNPGTGVDRDYFTFTVPAGHVLSALRLLPVTSVSGGSSFVALQAGPQLTVTPTGLGVENLLGFTHYGNDAVDTDLLPQLAARYPDGLPAGAYSLWVQETGGVVEYGFDLVLTALPAPPTADVPTLPQWGALVLGGTLLLAARRKPAC